MRGKILIIGLGYVGFSNAVLLGSNNIIVAHDISKKVINNKKEQLKLIKSKLNINFSNDLKKSIQRSDIIVIATPTNFNEESNQFDTSSVEISIKSVIENKKNISPIILIRSTVPVGFTQKMIKKYDYENIYFMPEFLKEGNALYDIAHPSRIIVGVPKLNDYHIKSASNIINMYLKSINKKDVETLIVRSQEAEAIKLFSNSYLAMRIAFFNELDSYAEENNLSTSEIIKGICSDPRIGDFYNNPSFGYGGYCLPKDSKQLKSSFGNIPNNLIGAIVDSNVTRKKFIFEKIKEKISNQANPIIGIYRLTMKKDSDNFRQSSIIDVLNYLIEDGFKVIIYEPLITCKEYNHIKVINDLGTFKKETTLIIANRIDDNLTDVLNKVYTRDLFKRD